MCRGDQCEWPAKHDAAANGWNGRFPTRNMASCSAGLYRQIYGGKSRECRQTGPSVAVVGTCYGHALVIGIDHGAETSWHGPVVGGGRKFRHAVLEAPWTRQGWVIQA